MWNLLILALDLRSIPRTWFLLPLILVVSLVYSASRYESPDRIIRRAGRLTLTILVVMGLVFALLYLLSYGL